MKSSRRSFLKIAGLAAAGLGTGPVLRSWAAGGGAPAPKIMNNAEALEAKRWAMVIDTRRFHSADDLQPMIDVCHSIHNVPHLKDHHHEIKWIWSEPFGNAFPEREHEFMTEKLHHLPFLVLCNHCENPPCVRACPTKATFKRPDGIVLMDFHRCIGCRFCMAACPYGARSFNFRDPRPFITHTNLAFPTRTKGVVEKCNFCAERLAVGQIPACVEVSDGALTFGDLDDPASQVRHVLKENFTIRRKQGLGTGPGVYYIV